MCKCVAYILNGICHLFWWFAQDACCLLKKNPFKIANDRLTDRLVWTNTSEKRRSNHILSEKEEEEEEEETRWLMNNIYFLCFLLAWSRTHTRSNSFTNDMPRVRAIKMMVYHRRCCRVLMPVVCVCCIKPFCCAVLCWVMMVLMILYYTAKVFHFS